jgi:hypothetical protein
LIQDIRLEAKERLGLAEKSERRLRDDPHKFWKQVEEAGLLRKALALYDRIAAEWEEYRHLRRETKAVFAERIEREGRQAEVEQVRRKLLASHMTQREVHAELVNRFQPLDGTETRPWETPDPWEGGRLFRRSDDEMAALAKEDPDSYGAEEVERSIAEARLAWARIRQDERDALANARRRARKIKRIRAPRPQTPPQGTEAAPVG